MNLTIKNYFLAITRILRKVYLLQVTIENQDIPFHTTIFTISTVDEVYCDLFDYIREINKENNELAYLHIPTNWSEDDYKTLLDVFNQDSEEVKLSRDGITLVNKITNPLPLGRLIKLIIL
jgi:hypothetical protein